MLSIPQPGNSGNEKALTPDLNSFSERLNSADFDAGYSLLEPHEVDPNPGELPPDFQNETQAALNAHLRGFDVIPLQQDGTPANPNWQNVAMSDPAIIREVWAGAPGCKAGGVTDGLVVVSVSGPEGFKQVEALTAGKRTPTAAVHPHGGESAIRFILRLPDGIRSPKESISLAPGVEVLPDTGYIELPSGPGGCCWENRRPIAPAPPWVVDRLLASQTNGSEAVAAGAAAMDAFRKGQLPDTEAPLTVLPGGSSTPWVDAPAEIADAEKDEDASEKAQRGAPTKSARAAAAAPIDLTSEPLSPSENTLGYCKALRWIMSDERPDTAEPTGHESILDIARRLREQFKVSLGEATALAVLWSDLECDSDARLAPAEIATIVRREYSKNHLASASDSTAKRYASKLEAALDHARRGFRVFPLAPNGKEPLMKEWPYAATSDKDRIGQWFKENPDYNIAIFMGSGLAGVDVDERHGGFETFEALSKAENVSEHATLTTVTASGSLHLIYRLPEDVRLKKGGDRFGKGIDLQTGSAYLVAPGSTIKDNPKYPHCDGEYRWLNDKPIAQMPDGLIEIARRAGSAQPKSKNAGKQLADELDTDWAIEEAEKYVAGLPEVPDGERNTTAIKVIFRLGDLPLSDAKILELATVWDQTKCIPPLGSDIIAQKVHGSDGSRQNARSVTGTSNGFEPTQIAEPDDGPAKAESKSEDTFPDPVEPRAPLATPYIPKDPATIPPRKWVIRDVLCKPHVSVLIGPAGVSKTNMLLLEAVALVTGRHDLLGMPIKKRSRVWFWNQEDPLEELERRLAALLVAYNIKAEDLSDENGKPMLYLNSGVDDPLMLGTLADRSIKRGKQIDQVIQDIQSLGIDVVIFDPLVEFHDAPEIDNTQIKKVVGFIREICAKSGCAAHVAAHTRKPDKASSKSFAGDLDSLRGGAAQGGVVRIAHTLLQACPDDAKEWRMEGHHHGYVRLDHAKNQFGRKWTEPRWFQFDEMPIGMESENVGFMRYVDLGPQTDNRLDILAAAMKKAGVAEERATTVVESLPEDQRRLFGKSRRHWAREVQKAFFGPPKHEYEGGVLSWECSGGRSPVMLKFQSAPTAH